MDQVLCFHALKEGFCTPCPVVRNKIQLLMQVKNIVVNNPFAIVLQFEPSSGPVDGGTRVTIHGHNFGTDAPHVKDFSASVKVALVDCVIEYRNESRSVKNLNDIKL